MDRIKRLPTIQPPLGFPLDYLDKPAEMDGLHFLSLFPEESIRASFFDPQYRGILDKQKYGNEGVGRGQKRMELSQMSDATITDFIAHIARVLQPSGHLFLWVDKFHLCMGVSSWFADTSLRMVDLIVWYKERMGMGYRSRRTSEYLLVLQKPPIRVKDVWTRRNIRDVWIEKVSARHHTHTKPHDLQKALIESVTTPNDVVLDPAMGSGSVFSACLAAQRHFVGCDLDLSRMLPSLPSSAIDLE